MKTFIATFALLTSVTLAQPVPPPNQPPVPMPPQQMPMPVPAEPCGPVLDLYDANNGAWLRTCQTGNRANAYVRGRFMPGFISDAVTASDGSSIILRSWDQLVQVYGRSSQVWDIAPSRAILKSEGNIVTTYRDARPTMQYHLNPDGSQYARPVSEQSHFPWPCSQIIEAQPGTVYCLDRDNGRVYRSLGSPFQAARPEAAQLWFTMEGIEFAKLYKGGLLVLVRPAYECGPPVEIPESATFCSTSSTCKEVYPAQLVYVSGREQLTIHQVAVNLSVNYYSTMSVVGDAAYIVESSYDRDRRWLGDFVSRVDLVNGRKTTYFSLGDFYAMFGPSRPPDLFIK